jgi:hypothetical protein
VRGVANEELSVSVVYPAALAVDRFGLDYIVASGKEIFFAPCLRYCQIDKKRDADYQKDYSKRKISALTAYCLLILRVGSCPLVSFFHRALLSQAFVYLQTI